ncbi:hypothetical protein EYF80_067299 [Liparis tanakae]|uniref:Uncharacterized protein n=1 Tax=Liparis tanakae TaxID=230148 RepID=A0A4Z2E1H5_9TELE|nr:hypothetical protein EYF80_067299 [Liparis tanakae]
MTNVLEAETARHGAPDEDAFKPSPSCFFATSEQEVTTLRTEDLSLSFSPAPTEEPLDARRGSVTHTLLQTVS